MVGLPKTPSGKVETRKTVLGCFKIIDFNCYSNDRLQYSVSILYSGLFSFINSDTWSVNIGTFLNYQWESCGYSLEYLLKN